MILAQILAVIIFALGREFGSGGHYVAQKIAQDLGLNYYDRKMLEDIAEEKISVLNIWKSMMKRKER